MTETDWERSDMAYRIELAPEVVWVVSEKDKKDHKGRQLWASQEKGGGVGFID